MTMNRLVKRSAKRSETIPRDGCLISHVMGFTDTCGAVKDCSHCGSKTFRDDVTTDH